MHCWLGLVTTAERTTTMTTTTTMMMMMMTTRRKPQQMKTTKQEAAPPTERIANSASRKLSKQTLALLGLSPVGRLRRLPGNMAGLQREAQSEPGSGPPTRCKPWLRPPQQCTQLASHGARCRSDQSRCQRSKAAQEVRIQGLATFQPLPMHPAQETTSLIRQLPEQCLLQPVIDLAAAGYSHTGVWWRFPVLEALSSTIASLLASVLLQPWVGAIGDLSSAPPGMAGLP
jgi:hypothetical protein